MVIRLERGADLHMAQLMPLLLTVSCFSEIQIGFILVPAHLGSPGQWAVKRVFRSISISYTSKTVAVALTLKRSLPFSGRKESMQ